jgi:hypothetical protein
MIQMDILLSTNSPTPELPTEIMQLINQYTFSHARINPAELLCPSFMAGYIRANSGEPPDSHRNSNPIDVTKSGSLVLISTSDTAENTIAMDGKGHLILSVSKDTHSTLGIPGHTSRFGPKGDRYCKSFTGMLLTTTSGLNSLARRYRNRSEAGLHAIWEAWL